MPTTLSLPTELPLVQAQTLLGYLRDKSAFTSHRVEAYTCAWHIAGYAGHTFVHNQNGPTPTPTPAPTPPVVFSASPEEAVVFEDLATELRAQVPGEGGFEGQVTDSALTFLLPMIVRLLLKLL